MMLNQSKTSQQQIHGFAIVETLVSLILISLSVLGIIVFLAGSQKNNNSQRSFIAAQGAGSNFIASVRSHIKTNNAAIYKDATINSAYPLEQCLNVLCTSQAYARRDIYFFIQRLLLSLNQPRYEIVVHVDYAELYVFWHDVIAVSQQFDCKEKAKTGESCLSFYETLSY